MIAGKEQEKCPCLSCRILDFNPLPRQLGFGEGFCCPVALRDKEEISAQDQLPWAFFGCANRARPRDRVPCCALGWLFWEGGIRNGDKEWLEEGWDEG